MSSASLPDHPALRTARRFSAPQTGRPALDRFLEWTTLCLCGLTAAALTVLVRTSFGLPGHNIVRVVFPIALGLALVPRRGSASLMGLTGLGGAAIFTFCGVRGAGTGAMTSLLLIGLLIEAALWHARSGRSVWMRLVLAGLAANLIALAVRSGTKLVLGEPLDPWLGRALVSYPTWGILAGLIGAAAWFRPTGRQGKQVGSETQSTEETVP